MKSQDSKRERGKAGRRERRSGAESASPAEPAAPTGKAEEPTGSSESFEASFSRAENALDALERGELSLEDALRTYEDGVRGLRRCYEILRAFERRIEVLGSELGSVAEGESGPVWVPAEAEPGLREAMGAVDRTGDLPFDPESGPRDPEGGPAIRKRAGGGTPPAPPRDP